MPRGYLKKHQQDVGRKISRGGSSCRERPPVRKQNHGASSSCRETCFFRDSGEDDMLLVPLRRAKVAAITSARADTAARTKPSSKPQATCPICLEDCTVIPLLRKSCAWHPSACDQCLRQHYVNYCLPNVTQYPLRCFYPGCEARLRDHQVKAILARGDANHCSANSIALQQYFCNSVLAKAYQSTSSGATNGSRKNRPSTVVHCPTCGHPRQFVKPTKACERICPCANCKTTFYCVMDGTSSDPIVLDRETLRATEIMGLVEGHNEADGWGLCPVCNIILSGGNNIQDDGEGSVECTCCQSLVSWNEAQQRVQQISRHVRKYMPESYYY